MKTYEENDQLLDRLLVEHRAATTAEQEPKLMTDTEREMDRVEQKIAWLRSRRNLTRNVVRFDSMTRQIYDLVQQEVALWETHRRQVATEQEQS